MDRVVLAAMADNLAMAEFLQKVLGYAITGYINEEMFVIFAGLGPQFQRDDHTIPTKEYGHFLC